MTFDEMILQAPTNPGIYKMFDSAGKLLYVGKAKNLIKRLRQYSDSTRLEYHKVFMMRQVAKVEWVVTGTEKDALVLEQHLIKTEKPKYNIILKDDKMYPFLALSDDAFPRLYRFRGKIQQKKDVFGPFPFVSDLDETIKLIQKVCQLRTCTNCFMSGHSKRPCILGQTGRCCAPCCHPEIKDDYKRRVAEARKIITGRTKSVSLELTRNMKAAAAAMDYEAAAGYLEKLRALQSTCEPLSKTDIIPRKGRKK